MLATERPAAPRTRETAEVLFDVRQATVMLEERAILAPLDLQVHPGEVVGLIGHNGSGKSTLLRLLSRQLVPSSGQITFAGQPIASWRSREFARQVAYLPQQPPAAGGMLCRELVELGRYPWHGAIGRFDAEDREMVTEALKATDTLKFAARAVDSLSGGERQRVWLAMLIAQNARCLLLDEPTAALDLAHQVEVLALIRELARHRGLSVVIVLHEINMAARFCDRLVALRAGSLIEDATPGAIMEPGMLERIFGLPMGIVPHPDGGQPIAYAR